MDTNLTGFGKMSGFMCEIIYLDIYEPIPLFENIAQ